MIKWKATYTLQLLVGLLIVGVVVVMNVNPYDKQFAAALNKPLPIKWEYKMGKHIAEYWADKGVVYLFTDEQELILLDSQTGKLIESYKLDMKPDGLIGWNDREGDLMALSFDSSIKVVNLKEKRIVTSVIPDSLLHDSGRNLLFHNTLMYVEMTYHDVVGVDATTGREIWRMKTDSRFIDFFKLNNQCFVSIDHWVYQLDSTNGKVLKKYEESIGTYYGGTRNNARIRNFQSVPQNSELLRLLKNRYNGFMHVSDSGYTYDIWRNILQNYGKGTDLLWELTLPAKITDGNSYDDCAILELSNEKYAVIELEKKKVLFIGKLDLAESRRIYVDGNMLLIPRADGILRAVDLEVLKFSNQSDNINHN